MTKERTALEEARDVIQAIALDTSDFNDASLGELALIIERERQWNRHVAKMAVVRGYTVTYREHTIHSGMKSEPWLIDGCMTMWGYSVVKDGVNAMPGATWFQTVEDAKDAIDVLIAVGGEKNSDRFWRELRMMKAHMELARLAYLKLHAGAGSQGDALPNPQGVISNP